MTNEQIIFNESIALMEKGILKGTGRTFTVEMEDGTKKTIEEPETIHTFAMWQQLGRQVKKGEHAKAIIYIWKCTIKNEELTAKNDKGEEVTINQDSKNMFKKKAFFFTLDQTEPIKDKKKTEKKAEPVQLETVNSFVIDANYIDSLLEA